MEYTESCVSSELKYEGIIVKVRLDEARLHTGKLVRREVVEHSGGVGILPIDENGDCYMVEQFRYPFMRSMLEIPAGKLEKGEDHYLGAVRELSEETGLSADKIIYTGAVASSPGFCTEMLHIYLAFDLHQGQSHPDEGEYLNVKKINIKELSRMAMDGEIDDAKTMIAILKAEKYLRERREQ